MDFDDLYPGRFMKAGNIGEGNFLTLTIKSVYHEDLEGEEGEEQKAIMSFVEPDSMQIVLAKVNGACCKEMFGLHVPNWIGKRITLYATNKILAFPRERGDTRPKENCIRVYGSPEIMEDMKVLFPVRKRIIKMTMKPTGAPAPPKAPAQDWPGWMVKADLTPERLKPYMVAVGMPPSLRDLDPAQLAEVYDNPAKYGDAVRAFEASGPTEQA
jgi:hypothetical protein